MKIDFIDIIFWSLIILYALYTIIYEKRSIRSKIIEDALKLSKYKTLSSSEKILNAYLKKTLKKQEESYKLPLMRFKNKPILKKYNNMDYYVFNENKDKSKRILYLHGGSYIENPMYFHFEFLEFLSTKVDYEIIIPIYPKAPKYNYHHCYTILIPFIKKMYGTCDSEIIFMGDSAGGGLATSLAMYFAKHKLKTPQKLILISPWLDISMKNSEIFKVEKKDPQLSKKALKIAASLWSNSENKNNYLLSPINGDLTLLKDVLIIIGTNDILYPDCKKFYRKAKLLDIYVKLSVYKKMLHVFPLTPIPEAKEARKEILNMIKK